MIPGTGTAGRCGRVSRLIVGTLALLILGLLPMAGGCGPGRKSEPEMQLEPVTVYEAVHSVLYAPFYVSLGQGFFQEEGLEVTVETAGGSDRAARALLSGLADVALGGPEPAVYLYREEGRAPLKVFALLAGRDGSYLMAREPEAGFSWQGVRNKTIIGSRPGGMPEMVLEYVLRREGVKPHDDVDIVTDLDPARAADAFKEGQGDYVLLFEPDASLFEKEGVGFAAAAMGEAGGPLPYAVFSAAGAFLDEKPEIIQSFVNAGYRGLRWIGGHDPAETADLLAPYFPETPRDVLARLVDRYRRSGVWPPVPALVPDQFARLGEIMAIGGVLGRGGRIDFEELTDDRFVRQALRNHAFPPPAGGAPEGEKNPQ